MYTKHSVTVVEMMMTRAMTQNCTLGSSFVRKEAVVPITHIIATWYTLHPMYRLSFRTGMLTFRVPQDRKQQKT